jgi:hypothetical protein
MASATAVRVAEHTAPRLNDKIMRHTEKNIQYYVCSGGRNIDERLKELDGEWDIERAIAMNDSVSILGGMLFGLVFSRRWFLLPALIGAFLLQHAIQGWCPLVPLLRRFGLRTEREIDYERYSLKLIRGDYQNVPDRGKPAEEQAAELLNAQKR